MKKTIIIRSERTFGAVLGDGMKIVFRNIRPMFAALLAYVGPILLLVCLFIIFSGFAEQFFNPFSHNPDNISSVLTGQVIMVGGMVIAMVMMNLIVYSTIIEYQENQGQITADGIKRKVKRYFTNYLGSIVVQALIIGGIIAVAASSLLISPVVFGLVYIMGVFIGVWIYNIIQFLGLVRIEEGLSVSDGLARCFYLVKNNWWSTFGLIFTASIFGTMILYNIMIFGFILAGLFANIFTGGENPGGFDLLLTLVFGVFAILYVVIMTASNILIAGVRALKYYDLVEKKDATQLMEAIDRIGRQEDSFFANEGDY